MIFGECRHCGNPEAAHLDAPTMTHYVSADGEVEDETLLCAPRQPFPLARRRYRDMLRVRTA